LCIFGCAFSFIPFSKLKRQIRNFNRRKKKFIYPPFAETFQKTGKTLKKKTLKAAPSFMEIQDFPQSSVFRKMKEKNAIFLATEKKMKKT
jgi:hypothetical protein